MEAEEVIIHGRVIARRAAKTAEGTGIPVKSVRVNEYESKDSHTVTLTVVLDARALEDQEEA